MGYTPPSANRLRAAGGGAEGAAFSGQAVGNNTSLSPPGAPHGAERGGGRPDGGGAVLDGAGGRVGARGGERL
ncbi:MAG: hypothetical protein OXG04_19545 [Acidobacteria bacterium]|nr:hypothetical protein [Acidobacteriota bacterium]